MTRIAVVILNYNGEKLLRQFLPSVLKYSSPATVVVADNGSTDRSLSILQEHFPEVARIEFETNFGFCGGYNRALEKISADYYVLLNSDVEVTEGWLDPMIRLLETRPDIAAVQPKILSYRDRKRFEYAGAGGGFVDVLGYPFCRGRIFDHVETDTAQYNDEREIFWATGACLMIRSGIYHTFGGFDESFFAHMEEIDLCWKLQRSNHRVYYCGKSTVYHLGAATLDYNNPRKTYLNFRNGLILVFKHFDRKELLYKLPCRMLLDWLAAFFFLVKGNVGSALQVFRAHLHFLRGIGHFRRTRRQVQQLSPTYPRRNIHPGLIIFDYYLRRKKNVMLF